jgi:RNA polymerase sigma-70 factor (ECF subfamily)
MEHAIGASGAAGATDRAAAIQAWTPAQFADAFALHWRTLWAIAAGVLNQRSGADDVLQDAAMIALDKLADFQPGTNFVAWMGSIVRFTALNHMRRDQRGGPRLSIDDQPYAAENAPPPHEPDPRLAAALGVLDPVARACLVMRTTTDLSYQEIATALGIPEGTAMSHVHRSRATLRTLLTSTPGPARTGGPA